MHANRSPMSRHIVADVSTHHIGAGGGIRTRTFLLLRELPHTVGLRRPPKDTDTDSRPTTSSPGQDAPTTRTSHAFGSVSRDGRTACRLGRDATRPIRRN